MRLRRFAQLDEFHAQVIGEHPYFQLTSRGRETKVVGLARGACSVRRQAPHSGLHAAVAIKDLVSGDESLVNSDKVFPQGRSIRIHLIAELFRPAAAKKVPLDDVRPLSVSARMTGASHSTGRRGCISGSARQYFK